MNSKINLKHGYTLVFNKDETIYLKVETENDILEFDGIKGNIGISSEPWDSDIEEVTLKQMIGYSMDFFGDWGIETEVAEAIVRDLTPWFEKYAVDDASQIHLIFDRKLGCVYGATTDHDKAVEITDELNSNEIIVRYIINTLTDLASK